MYIWIYIYMYVCWGIFPYLTPTLPLMSVRICGVIASEAVVMGITSENKVILNESMGVSMMHPNWHKKPCFMNAFNFQDSEVPV